MKLNKIASLIGAKNTNYNLELEIVALNTISLANENEITFLENKKYVKDLEFSRAGAILIHENYVDLLPKHIIAIVCDEPYVAMARLSASFVVDRNIVNNYKDTHKGVQIADNVFIGENSKIANGCVLMAGVVVGNNVSIGENSIIYPNVSIYDNCVIGDNVIIHSGVVIGSDGFGFAISKSKKPYKIHHFGNVEIGDYVEIGANTTVDRAVFNSTIIKKYTKIDNGIQIGHNTIIDECCIIAAHTAIAGSVVIGKNVIIAGSAGVAGHISICDNVVISAKTGVIKSINKAGRYSGFPMKEHKEWLKHESKLNKLTKR